MIFDFQSLVQSFKYRIIGIQIYFLILKILVYNKLIKHFLKKKNQIRFSYSDIILILFSTEFHAHRTFRRKILHIIYLPPRKTFALAKKKHTHTAQKQRNVEREKLTLLFRDLYIFLKIAYESRKARDEPTFHRAENNYKSSRGRAEPTTRKPVALPNPRSGRRKWAVKDPKNVYIRMTIAFFLRRLRRFGAGPTEEGSFCQRSSALFSRFLFLFRCRFSGRDMMRVFAFSLFVFPRCAFSKFARAL